MDRRRAVEIRESHGVINVSFNGIPVWIESIGEEDAEISFIGMNGRQTVSLAELTEADPVQTL